MAAEMASTGTVCYIRDGDKILLQLKARDRFGGGFWNAPGGKLVDGESTVEATVREVREETGLAVDGLVEHGPLTFYFGEAEEPSFTVHVFSTARFSGELRPSDEGRLEWFAETALPYDDMWPDDRIWLPHMLAGRRFRGAFRLTEDWQTLVWHELELDPQSDASGGV